MEDEQLLLESAKDGISSRVRRLLKSRVDQISFLNINCRSKSQGSSGWTPLHLACYHGNEDVVDELLKAGADVNIQDDLGDTPLHKAVSTGRKVNHKHNQAKEAQSPLAIHGRVPEQAILRLFCCYCVMMRRPVSSMEQRRSLKTSQRMMKSQPCSRVSKLSLEEIVQRQLTVSALVVSVKYFLFVCFSRREKRGQAARGETAGCRQRGGCLRYVKDTGWQRSRGCALQGFGGQYALTLCCLQRAQAVHHQAAEKTVPARLSKTTKGRQRWTWSALMSSNKFYLTFGTRKWAAECRRLKAPFGRSRFIGWRLHWVVIEDGTGSWYSRQAESGAGVNKQGSRSLAQAYCMVKPWDHCFFMLKCADNSALCFKVPSKTDSVASRKRWLDAFEAHSSYSTQNGSRHQKNVDDAEGESSVAASDVTQALQAASACQQKLESEVSIFLSMVKNEENCAKETSELSGETCAALQLCLQLLSKQEEVWSLKLEQEQERSRALIEALQTIATEHHELKQSLSKSRRSPTLCTLAEDDFYDAVSESESEFSVSGFLSVASYSCEEDEGRDAPLLSSRRHPSPLGGAAGMSGEGDHGNRNNDAKKHRTSLPAPMFSRNDVSIWSILKKCIGMELSKITMPVILNEPLSFLQRITEYMEHTYLIHRANATADSVERMKCVAAFAVSAVASQWERTGKPFNPLLGETYELIRNDLGFRWVSEQVSHHPPVSAFHAEGLKEDFVFHGSIYPKIKFWGKSIEAEPKGVITLELPKYNEAYTWTNPTCCVHNIIVGQLWIEQYGSVEVVNHKTGERCCMTFKPCGLFGKELHKVEGYILDKSKRKLCAIYGKWTECLYTVDPATFDANKNSDKRSSEEKKACKRNSVDEEPEEMPPPDAETVQVIPGSELIWKITPRPNNSAKFYAFSTFAMQLNESDQKMERLLPSTDSRLRPDIRAMENGDIDLASAEKKRLEEKQRTARKNRGKSTDDWKTRWFQQGANPHNKAQGWLYMKGYWDRKFTQLPDIY